MLIAPAIQKKEKATHPDWDNIGGLATPTRRPSLSKLLANLRWLSISAIVAAVFVVGLNKVMPMLLQDRPETVTDSDENRPNDLSRFGQGIAPVPGHMESIEEIAKRVQQERVRVFGDTIREKLEQLSAFDIAEHIGSRQDILLTVGRFSAMTEGVKSLTSAPLAREHTGLLAEFRSRLIQVQTFALPRLREAYAEIMRRGLWEQNITVTTSAPGHRSIMFTGGRFANNGTVKAFHQEIWSVLEMLRYDTIRYRWSEYADRNVRYDAKAPSDQELIIWRAGSRSEKVD